MRSNRAGGGSCRRLPCIAIAFAARQGLTAGPLAPALGIAGARRRPQPGFWNFSMTDFAAARRMMVDGQVRTSDVTDLSLIAAMLEIPRERFVPADQVALAYLDRDLPLAGAPLRCLLKPMVLAQLIQAAEIGTSDRVLDVGCATGYGAAVLARLAGSVIALEGDAALARRAVENLGEIGAANVTVETGPLAEGWQAGAPYDAILLEGSFEIEPKMLLRQLKDGGRLVGVRGRGGDAKAVVYRGVGLQTSGRAVFDATAPLLPGFAASPAFVF
jgi:protein-L-isoaspartate(D-aspartate) O-methyltransferase